MATRHRGPGPRILVIASGGGHWVQLMRLRRAFADTEVTYVSTLPGYASEVEADRFHCVRDASRWDKFGLLIQAFQVLWILLRVRPAVVVTTGAAPGFFAVRFGKWLGARTVWIDSIANVDELSLSGRKAGAFVDLWVTQWPHLATTEGPHCFGAVL